MKGTQGLLTLTGANTFLGGLTIGSGTLRIGDGGTAGSVAAAIINNAALEYNRSDALTQASNISGSGTLRKLGGGELTLSGNNTFTGLTTIEAGTLTLSGGSALHSAGAVLIADSAAAVLQLATSQTIGSIAGGAGNGQVRLQSSVLTVGDANDTELSAVVSGAGGLVKQGVGVLSLSGVNSFTGGVGINAGTLALKGGAAIADTVTITLANTAGAVLRLEASERVGTVIGGGAIGGELKLGTYVLTLGGAADGEFAGVVSGDGSLVKVGAGTLTLSGANTFTGGVTVSAGVLKIGNATITGSVSSGIVNNSALVFDRTSDFTFDANISGTGSLTQQGSAVLTLSGNNSFSGVTYINSGTLALSGGSALPDTAAVVMADNAGAVLRLNAEQTIGSLAGGAANGGVELGVYRLNLGDASSTTIAAAVSGAGGLTKRGAGTVTLSGVNTFEGLLQIQGGTVTLASAGAIRAATGVVIANIAGATLDLGASVTIGSLSGAGTAGGRVSLNNYTLTTGDSTDTTFSGVLSGNGGLLKQGAGTFNLSGTNTYLGSTSVNEGTLSLGGTLSSTVLTVAPAATFNSQVGSALPTAAQLTANGSVNLFNASVTLQTLFGSGAVTLNGTALTLSNGSFSGALNSTGSLLKTSSGLLTLSGNNGYNGATSVNEGTLTLSGTLASAVLSVASGATFNSESGSVFPATSSLSADGLVNLLNTSVTVQTLLGAGIVTLNGTALTLSNGTFSGALNSSGSLIKTSGGLLTLSGSNGYIGSTTVNEGSLTLAAGGALASVNLTVGVQGTFNSANGSLLPTASVLNVDGAVNLFNSGVEIATLLGGGVVALNGTALTLGNGTFSGALNSSGSLIKTSSGLLTLSGNNGYTGVTSVNAGTLTLTGSLASANLTVGAQGTFNSENGSLLPTASVLNVDGALNLSNSGVEIATLLGSGIVTLNGTALTLSNGTFSGALNSSGSLTKTSGGLLTLSGNNGFSGATTVNQGSLTLASGGTLASANLTVGAQGTFNS
ncbi:MAG: hypothetical protein EBS01_09340, partial [Verrucomicrobia bacterium]|nr:hypothetical protein [Verrucomicrobiota bacterium]